MKKEPETESRESGHSNLLPIILEVVKHVQEGLLSAVFQKVNHFSGVVMRRIMMAILLLIGVVFIMIGFAQLLGQLAGRLSFVGYLIVGGLAIVVALITRASKN